jgi:hypothetical protein
MCIPGYRWKDTIKIDLKEIRCDGVDWIHLPQQRAQWRALRHVVTNLRVPEEARNFLLAPQKGLCSKKLDASINITFPHLVN